MAANVKSNRFLLAAGCLAVAFAVGAAARPQSEPMVITLTGQSMIRSDIRAAAPAAVPVIQSLLNGDVKFTNFEAAVGEKGEAVHEGGGFLAPPEALDALTTLGFNLLSLSNNHAFDLKLTGLENTLREVKKRKIVHAGTGQNMAEAAAPGYLRTSKGTVALVALASGMIQPEGNATPDRPGVDELRIQMGDKPNEAMSELPGRAKRAERGGHAAHSTKHTHCPAACRHRHRLSAQSRFLEQAVPDDV